MVAPWERIFPRMPIAMPPSLTTARLVLHRWRPEHAPRLRVALEASVDHLASWIPWSIAEPASVEVLSARLAKHADDFDAGREWIYGIFPRDGSTVLGAIGLYPRDATHRVPIDGADRLELGYWLHVNATGHGYATEAARAAATLGETLPGIVHLEIRCDPRNVPSAAVPQRLGFTHATTEARPSAQPDEAARALMIWVRRVTR